jgi:hypothetical protein
MKLRILRRFNRITYLIVIGLMTAFVLGCNGGGGGGGDDDDDGPANYTISGTVSGLANDPVEICNNQGTPFECSENDTFSIDVPSGSSYDLSVVKNPNELLCRIENGSGNNIQADVSNIAVVCETIPNAAACTGGADSDADGLTDCAEVETWGTNPWLADTDGDLYPDEYETSRFDPDNHIAIYNPRIADLARFAVDLTSVPRVDMIFEISGGESEVVGTSHGQGSSDSISRDWGGGTSRQIEIGHSAKIENTTTVGVEVEISKEPSATFKLENALTLGFETSNSFTNGSSVNWSTTQEQANSTTYEESIEMEQSREWANTGGILELTAVVSNSGHIPYDLENLTLSAYFFDPKHPFEKEPIGTLEYGSGEFPTTPILSTSESETLNFSIEVTLDKAQRLLRDSKNIVVLPATYRLLDTDDSSILLNDADVVVRTAAVTIDYGVHAARQDKYRVAVNCGDGSKAVSLAKALQDILGLNISYGPGEWVYGDDVAASTTPGGLLAVGNHVMDTATNQYWLLAHNHTTDSGADRTTDFYNLLNEGYDIEQIYLRAGDKVTLVYVGDADRDGLSDRMERDYDTNPNDPDSDDDTLMDSVEIFGWMTDLNGPPCDDEPEHMVRVYGNPLSDDSDDDGTLDDAEKAQCLNPGSDFVADAGQDEIFANAGSEVTLYGTIISAAPVVGETYRWILLKGPDVMVDGEPVQHLEGSEPEFTAPDEVSTLVFRLEVTGDGEPSTDMTRVQVQKNVMEAFYVGDPNGPPDGSRNAPYATIREALVGREPGDDLYVMKRETPYMPPETLEIPVGVSLFGGYDANWVRDVDAHKTIIEYTAEDDRDPDEDDRDPAVQINGAGGEAWFSGFELLVTNASTDPDYDMIGMRIDGGDDGLGTVYVTDNEITAPAVAAGEPGEVESAGSSYALHVSNLSVLHISDNHLSSGNGGNGGEGADGETITEEIINGYNGGNGGILNHIGIGGPGPINGGNGGPGGYWPSQYVGYVEAKYGFTGLNNIGTYGQGGIPGIPGHGGDGSDGMNGNNGSTGPGGVTGLFDSIFFTPAHGEDGTDGDRGGGGGGGGGAGGNNAFSAYCTGGGGGGGGHGGVGGACGAKGSGGGASIGVWVYQVDTAYIRGNDIQTMRGGVGRAGGIGAPGRSGSNGGVGGSGGVDWPIYAYTGGNGGDGGTGGRGGDGGSGGGGPSLGIVVGSGCDAVSINGNTITTGDAGDGGAGNTTTAGHGGDSYGIYDTDGMSFPVVGSHTENTFNIGDGGASGIGGSPDKDGVSGEANFSL